jgi:uncharacterized protein
MQNYAFEIHQLGQALLLAFGMFWEVGWSLVLGFALSAIIQAFVSTKAMHRALGRDGPREITLATLAGAASSSCSYASAAVSRTLFKKGAALIPTLAFLFASTNLVIELGVILYLLMGWQFTAAEWLGGIVLVVLMSLLVRLTYPSRLVEEARQHPESGSSHEHEAVALEGKTIWQRLREPRARILIAQNFTTDWSMLWRDLLAGFLIAGLLAAFIPEHFWKSLFLTTSPPWMQIPANALLGPLVAIVSFVCSIGNVPMAAILWASGVSFGGVLAFLYADLIVLPLLDAYRRYYGWKMAAYIGLVFYVTMVAAAILMDLAFTAAGLVPEPDPNLRGKMVHFSLNYTFWLNLAFAVLAAYFFWLSWKHPRTMNHSHQRS